MMLLELGISKKYVKKHKILIVCSPMRRCIETGVLVAESIGITNISIHHGLTDTLSDVRDMGWNVQSLDEHVVSCTLNPREMDEIVEEIREPWKYVNNDANPPLVEEMQVDIQNIFGEMMSPSQLPELPEAHELRVSETLEDIAETVSEDGEHIIIIAHDATMNVFARHFGDRDLQVSDVKDCRYAGCLCHVGALIMWR